MTEAGGYDIRLELASADRAHATGHMKAAQELTHANTCSAPEQTRQPKQAFVSPV